MKLLPSSKSPKKGLAFDPVHLKGGKGGRTVPSFLFHEPKKHLHRFYHPVQSLLYQPTPSQTTRCAPSAPTDSLTGPSSLTGGPGVPERVRRARCARRETSQRSRLLSQRSGTVMATRRARGGARAGREAEDLSRLWVEEERSNSFEWRPQ